MAVDQKSNEVKALPELIKVLHLKGCIVTIDAMGCQKDVAKLLTTRKVGADYILAVKGNQGNLHRKVQEAFAGLDAAPASIPHFVAESSDQGHGRKEFRRVSTLDALWPICRRTSCWHGPSARPLSGSNPRLSATARSPMRSGSTSAPLQAAQAETIRVSVRAHWLIENQLHWTLDTAFREDGNRVRKGNGPECGAVLRHIALNLLRQDPNSTVRSINARRHRAGRLPQYRLAALLGFPEGCQTGVPPKRKKGYVAIKPGNETIHPLLLS